MKRVWIRAGLAMLCAGLAAGCGSQPGRVARAAPRPPPAPLDTSLVTAQGAWAIAVMGGTAADNDNFWQVFVRPAGASRWSLVTPPGVADNGGLVAAGGTGSLTIGVRPSQNLAFSPLATSTDAGKSWTPGLLDADLADSPGAIAVDPGPGGRTLALLKDGTIQAAGSASEAAAGQWRSLTTLRALSASAAGRECDLVSVDAISFGPDKNPVAAGSCARPGVAGIFTETGRGWVSAGLVLPAGFGRDRVQVLGLSGGVALLRAGTSLLAAWWDGTRWTVSAPVAGSLRASGFGAGGSVWVLLGGGRAETIGGAGAGWRVLPAVPGGTAVLAAGAGGWQALAVSGAKLTVWQLAGGAWTRAQLMSVPIEYGSSG